MVDNVRQTIATRRPSRPAPNPARNCPTLHAISLTTVTCPAAHARTNRTQQPEGQNRNLPKARPNSTNSTTLRNTVIQPYYSPPVHAHFIPTKEPIQDQPCQETTKSTPNSIPQNHPPQKNIRTKIKLVPLPGRKRLFKLGEPTPATQKHNGQTDQKKLPGVRPKKKILPLPRSDHRNNGTKKTVMDSP